MRSCIYSHCGASPRELSCPSHRRQSAHRSRFRSQISWICDCRCAERLPFGTFQDLPGNYPATPYPPATFRWPFNFKAANTRALNYHCWFAFPPSVEAPSKDYSRGRLMRAGLTPETSTSLDEGVKSWPPQFHSLVIYAFSDLILFFILFVRCL
ncbi:hypothetical protein C8R43DRAFT_163143 [Mycena crocata]|nr:hypothetical protein C8R43DRAFT_163143 [Mycena crocata]